MADKVLCDKSDLVTMANHVRETNNSAETFNVPELVQAVINLENTSIEVNTQTNKLEELKAILESKFT